MHQQEIKYVFHPRFTPLLVQWLGACCQQDKTFPANIVSSIYYDSADLSLLSAKRNSDYLKYKFRVRWYTDPVTADLSAAFAEIKSKIGSKRFKHRIPLDTDAEVLQNIRICDPIVSAIVPEVRRVDMSIDPDLKPVLQITYRRHRFVHPFSQTQLNVDWDIGPVKANPCFLRSIDMSFLPVVICEVKGQTTRLPEPMQCLMTMGGRREAYSKYYECYLSAARQHVR